MTTSNLINLLGYEGALRFILEKVEKGEPPIKSISDYNGKLIVKINI